MMLVTPGKANDHPYAASEPHVQELAHLLTAMGATIEGIGSNILTVYGTETLKGVEASIGPNHIEVGSIAANDSPLRWARPDRGCAPRRPAHDRAHLPPLRVLDMDEFNVYVPHHDGLSISNREEDVDASIESAPWPGFPSDLVAVATVLAT